jgi:hypothetical protein
VVEKILKYLQGIKNLWFQYTTSSGPQCDVVVTSSCDADWRRDIDNKRATIGFVFLLTNEAISWSSKRHPTVVVSTIEGCKHN